MCLWRDPREFPSQAYLLTRQCYPYSDIRTLFELSNNQIDITIAHS